MSAATAERIRGIDAPLPAGERVRWQGSPDVWALAVHVFHVRKLAVYFALLVAWRAALALGEAAPLAFFAVGALTLGACFVGAAAVAMGLAFLSARTTTYALTDRRLVLRIGMVLPATLNIPLRQVEAASIKQWRDGTGDLAVTLGGDVRVAYFLLWPHARPWRFNPTFPALRCIPEPERVGALLREAVAGCVDAAAVAVTGPDASCPASVSSRVTAARKPNSPRFATRPSPSILQSSGRCSTVPGRSARRR